MSDNINNNIDNELEKSEGSKEAVEDAAKHIIEESDFEETSVNKNSAEDTTEEAVHNTKKDATVTPNKIPERVEKAPVKKKRKGAKIGALAAAGVIVAAAVGYGAYVNAYDSIMPNTYVENINLGGMSQSEANDLLTKEYVGDRLTGKTVKFKCMGDESTILVENLAMTFEPEKMASDAYMVGREQPGFFKKLASFSKSLVSKNDIAPAITYDEQALTGAISDLCAPHEVEPLGYTFRIGDGNNIIIAKPQDGVKVNMEEAVEAVEEQICTFNFGDVEFVPVVTQAPEIDIDAFYEYITAPAQDATYAKDENNKVYVVPGKPQIVVSKAAIEEALKHSDEECSIPVQLVEPAVNTEFLQGIMYEDTLGTYTTDYGASSAARASNIRLSSSTISGLELLPGERFDFNKVVGQRTAARGYQQAPVYVVKEGKTESEMDYGGGICQVSSTIFCAVNRAGLKVVARTSHSKDVSYVPKGMDATVSWGGSEFIFENSTDYPIRIFVDANGGVLTTRIVGSKASKPNVSLDVQKDGSSVVVTKTITNADGSSTQEIIDSNTPVPTAAPTEVPVSAEEVSETVSEQETATE